MAAGEGGGGFRRVGFRPPAAAPPTTSRAAVLFLGFLLCGEMLGSKQPPEREKCSRLACECD